jgi:ABC-type ATPase with predicted acetyltransferase domain
LNKKLASISRVVLHPKYRSIGLGAHLVRETLSLCKRQYVETMAVMAQYNPFFEKAGMKRIAERKPDKSIIQAIKSLKDLGFKSYLLSSQQANITKLETMSDVEVRKVHEILLKISTVYYKRLRSTGDIFLKKDDFKKWLKKSSNEVLTKVLSRLAVLAETKIYLFWES